MQPHRPLAHRHPRFYLSNSRSCFAVLFLAQIIQLFLFFLLFLGRLLFFLHFPSHHSLILCFLCPLSSSSGIIYVRSRLCADVVAAALNHVFTTFAASSASGDAGARSCSSSSSTTAARPGPGGVGRAASSSSSTSTTPVAASYHAGLASGERITRQQAWVQGHVTIIVSTIAFGMIAEPEWNGKQMSYRENLGIGDRQISSMRTRRRRELGEEERERLNFMVASPLLCVSFSFLLMALLLSFFGCCLGLSFSFSCRHGHRQGKCSLCRSSLPASITGSLLSGLSLHSLMAGGT